jgi:hypothetical protein
VAHVRQIVSNYLPFDSGGLLAALPKTIFGCAIYRAINTIASGIIAII